MMPTSRAVLCAALGFVLALLPTLVDERLWLLWLIALGALILAFATDALLLPRPQQISVRCEIPDHIEVGTAFDAVLRLTGLGRYAPRLRAHLDNDLLFETIRPAEAAIHDDSAELIFPIQTRRRGETQLGPLALRVTGRLGLVHRQFERELDRTVTVLPDIRPVRFAAMRTSFTEARDGLRVERFRGDGSEFDSLREFVEGDDARYIDWRHSARHRRLTIRQHRAERNSQVVLAIDTGRLMSETMTGVTKLDHAITASLLLSYVCLKVGDRVGFYSFGAQAGSFLSPRAGMRTQHLLTQNAAGLDYGKDETNFTLGLTTLAQRLRRRSMIVVLTDFVDTVTAELMIENVTRLARRHLIVFVALQDPRLGRIQAADPASVLRLNRSVVATRMVREREIVLRRLRDEGVLCVDARPDEISGRTIDAYLDIKRRERI